MKNRAPALLALALCACGAGPPATVRETVVAPAEDAAAIARVETGLIADRRVVGRSVQVHRRPR